MPRCILSYVNLMNYIHGKNRQVFLLHFPYLFVSLVQFFTKTQKGIIMGEFFKNILKMGEESGILEGLKEKLGGGVLDAVKEKLNLENMDLGSLAQSVLSIIGLAGNSVATEEEAEVVEEETVVEEE